MEIVVVLYIVGIALIMGYLINRYPRERVSFHNLIRKLYQTVVGQINKYNQHRINFNRK